MPKDIEQQMREAIKTRFGHTWERVRCPSLKKMAEFIRERLGYEVTVETSTTNTDTHYRGSRIRRPGKGRSGNKISVYNTGYKYLDDPVFEHDSSGTYRHNTEVAEWILDQLKKRNA